MENAGFNSRENILYITTTGTPTMDDMLLGLEFLKKNIDLPRNLRVLEDATMSKALFSDDKLALIIERLEDVLTQYTSYRHAVIHHDPHGTALAMLTQSLINNPIYELGVFCTFDAAKAWLMSK